MTGRDRKPWSRRLQRVGPWLISLWLVACGGLGSYQGTHLDPAQEMPPITGLDHKGQPFDSEGADLNDKILVVFFGYVFCPDYCPLIMHEITEAYEDHLVRQQDAIEVLFVTIDPERDSPAQLAQYTASFHADFTGVYIADTAALEILKTRYGVFAETHVPEGNTASQYLVDHSTRTYVLNRKGKLELAYGPDIQARDLARDLKRLLR